MAWCNGARSAVFIARRSLGWQRAGLIWRESKCVDWIVRVSREYVAGEEGGATATRPLGWLYERRQRKEWTWRSSYTRWLEQKEGNRDTSVFGVM